MANDDPSSPLTPLSLHLLLALAKEDLHGYALIEAVREQSEGAVNPGTGSLYAALQRLEDDGLLDVSEVGQGRRGKTYRLTADGRHAVEQEVARLRRVLALAEERRLLPESGGG